MMPWEFEYDPVHRSGAPVDPPTTMAVAALSRAVDPQAVAAEVPAEAGPAWGDSLISASPVHWVLLRLSRPVCCKALSDALCAAELPIRYVVSACHETQCVAPPLPSGIQSRPNDWAIRSAHHHDEHPSPGRWFLGELGVAVHRGVCATGAGTRLAVIDASWGGSQRLDLEREVPVGVSQVVHGSTHGTRMVAWAVGTAPCPEGKALVGVAPDASVRAYAIPRPGTDVFTFPLAVIRAVLDGADVVLAATFLEGLTGPLLDDALEVAYRHGRGGRGTPIVLPVGREVSSPEGSVHASLALGLGEPGAHPRVFCIAPSGRDGGWFLWQNRKGQWLPFANRSPAVRWLSPGDDLADPFGPEDRLAHAESSGAAAVAAGALLLVLGQNPSLSWEELHEALLRSTTAVSPICGLEAPCLGDPHDVLPAGRDRDGHNAKHGYGRLNAELACLLVCDPVTQVLAEMGEHQAARRHLSRRAALPRLAYSPDLARWAARALLSDSSLRHALAVLLRHLRLIARSPDGERSHAPGAMLRHLFLLLGALDPSRRAPPPSRAISQELQSMSRRVAEALCDDKQRAEWETALGEWASAVWRETAGPARPEAAAPALRAS